MEITKLLTDYPKEAASGIAVISAAIGWTFRNIIQIIVDNIKYKKELKTFFWKEKLNAAKKASEFYLENLNFLNLVRHQFEIFEQGNIEHQELFGNIQKEVNFYSEKLKSFPHFEHHHINIFYDFNENRAMEINTNSFEVQQKIFELMPNELDTKEELDTKISSIKAFSKQLKNNYAELFEIQKKYLGSVRKDIKEYL